MRSCTSFDPRRRAAGRMRRARPLAVIAVASIVYGCAAGPAPIAYDQDACAFCRMQISDPRYGTELVTRTGKMHKFDSIECLASFYSSLQDGTGVRALWVSDYRKPGNFIPASEALFIHHDGPGSPMGRGLLAVAADRDAADRDAASAGVPAGDTLSWAQVVELVATESLAPAAARRRRGGSVKVEAGAGDADAHER